MLYCTVLLADLWWWWLSVLFASQQSSAANEPTDSPSRVEGNKSPGGEKQLATVGLDSKRPDATVASLSEIVEVVRLWQEQPPPAAV